MENEKLPVSIPASVGHIALYLSFLLRKKKTSAVSLAHAALKWVHGFLPTQHNPADTVLCRNLVEAEKRQRLVPIKKKQPASVNLIKEIISTFAHKNASLKDLRSATMFAVCFAGLFRAKELLGIRVCDIQFESDHARIHVPTSKTDVYREGQDVFIWKSNTNSCPVSLLRRYLCLAGITAPVSNNSYLFRNVVYLKSVNKYVLGNRVLSYTRFRELFKECLKEIGQDEHAYSLHSFRAGGATAIVQNFPDLKSKERLLKLHGRWKSDVAKDMYIHEDIHERLSVSKCMGL